MVRPMLALPRNSVRPEQAHHSNWQNAIVDDVKPAKPPQYIWAKQPKQPAPVWRHAIPVSVDAASGRVSNDT